MHGTSILMTTDPGDAQGLERKWVAPEVALADAKDVLLGRQLRELRLARGLSIKDVAGRAELSVGTISQIERGLGSASIRSLRNICQALDVPLGILFRTSESAAEMESQYVRRERQRGVLRLGHGTVKELLSTRGSTALELLLVNIEPGGSSGPDSYSHEGEELGLVIAGVLDLWIADQLLRLNQGDSFGFPSTLPHRFANSGTSQCRIFWVNSPPLY